MKSHTRRILFCLIPVLAALGVVIWAYNNYTQGRGGFRLGVDLSGGTILVYEVDDTKELPADFEPEALAKNLKERIDPADLYQITIRSIPADPPRVEVILPTGSLHQRQAEQRAWEELKKAVNDKYDIKDPDKFYADVSEGDVVKLAAEINKKHPDTPIAEINTFLDEQYTFGRGGDRKRLTTEEIEQVKNLISQQGLLEFRILANTRDDSEGITAAKKLLQDPEKKQALETARIRGEAPPAPSSSDGSGFDVTIRGETTQHRYKWAEIGKSQLHTLRLDSEARKGNKRVEEVIERARENKSTEIVYDDPNLIVVRTIPKLRRDRNPKDTAQNKTVEFFMLVREPKDESENVIGDFLTNARSSFQNAKRVVEFTFNAKGGDRFYRVTSRNRPTDQFKRHLAIILDNRVMSAPELNSPIRTSGIITGDFSQQEINDLVRILDAGKLPATLKRQPVSENSMGPTLGADTIRKGTRSIIWAFVVVLAFMLVYYRFAGFVACCALLANLLMTVAFMVLFKATFTLPGLAGLVLTLGIAVDSNILIYERLREERDRGASLALAIRNGYDKAFSTIIDTHLTSIFTAIVLYIVGNDQLKGFGISLAVGLLFSLFTALYLTRTIFEVALGQGWLQRLYFMQLFRRPNIDFMRIRYQWFTITLILTVLGAALFIYRMGHGGLNIDFVGGTAYTGVLTEPMSLTKLRKELDASEIPEQVTSELGMSANEVRANLGDLSIEQIFTSESTGGKSRYFTVRSSWPGNQGVTAVQSFINAKLGDKLKRIGMKAPRLLPSTAPLAVTTLGASIAPSGQFWDAIGLTLLAQEQSTQATGAVLNFVDPSAGDSAENPDNTKAYASRAQVTRILREQFDKNKLNITAFRLDGEDKQNDRFSQMTLDLIQPEKVDRSKLRAALEAAANEFKNNPQPERLENFDKQLASDTQQRAFAAILASWVAILLYLWFRFGNWTFGLACVACLLHDLFFTLGIIAACHWLYDLPIMGSVFLLEDFKIDLPTVAALLTLVGYSVNDTIVVFDRIREVRGKNPLLTTQMINDSVNQTLSRTVLSSLTIFLVVVVLYFFGGEGIHLFAFVMLVGVIVGTYSSIYIASPLLLFLGEGTPSGRQRAPQPTMERETSTGS